MDESQVSGYSGRMAIHEVMPINEMIKEKVMHGAAAGEIKRLMVQEYGMRTLRMDGVWKALRGMTTLDEGKGK